MNENLFITNYAINKRCSWIKTDAYRFKWKWLKKILLFFRLIKEFEEEHLAEVTKKVINREDIKKQIISILTELEIEAKELDYMVIGRKQVHLLDNEWFVATYNENFKYDFIWHSIPIKINPFIDGIVPILKK